MKPYEPREGSIPDKVLGWLESNGGRLTATEIAENFGANSNDVPKLLRNAVTHGLLRRIDDGYRVHYQLP